MSSSEESDDKPPGDGGGSEGPTGGPDYPIGPPTPDTAAAIQEYAQGHVLRDITELTVTVDDGSPAEHPCPLGVVVVTQTCDLVQSNRHTVQLAPVVRITDPAAAAQARSGARPRFVHLPAIGDDLFADLEVIATVSKAWIASREANAGVVTDLEVQTFGYGVGRRFSRFAFPDSVHEWLEPLSATLASKYPKETSPEGRALKQVVELRIEATSEWTAGPPFDLTLSVIVRSDELPFFPDDELPDLPEKLNLWLYRPDGGPRRGASEIAQRLLDTVDPVERYFLWGALADAWALKCSPRPTRDSEVLNAVRSLNGEVLSESEYSLAQYRRSVQLDLDYLSDPPPS